MIWAAVHGCQTECLAKLTVVVKRHMSCSIKPTQSPPSQLLWSALIPTSKVLASPELFMGRFCKP